LKLKLENHFEHVLCSTYTMSLRIAMVAVAPVAATVTYTSFYGME